MTPLYFATPFRTKSNPHLIGFNEIDQKSRIFTPMRGTVAELPVDQARNVLVEDFLQKTQGIDDAWLFFIDDDVLLPTDTLDLWLEAVKANPASPVFFGEYSLKKRALESAHVYNDTAVVTMATGLCLIHKSVFLTLREQKVTAFGLPKYDGRWFICSQDKPGTGEDTYFTATLGKLGITPVKIPDLEGVHVDFSRLSAHGSPDIVANGKIRKDKAWIYAIDPTTSPIYNDLVKND